ncbi:hypothetical protein [Streptomyces sp. CNS654]|uniref:hypothetical protein n=1 Tax=Streptomyces sp. CNS654 TaxID=1506995 RepID=UPI0018F89FB1|nr:hypothetical protein [Streptomyces sp. CNS654]
MSADDERFKEVSFVEGLNLIVASTTASSADTDSRNSAGKSSLIELIHFLLGSRATNTALAMNKALRHITFSLEMDWPGLSSPLSVRRSGQRAGFVTLNEDVTGTDDGAIFPRTGAVELPVERWTQLIERDLFGLRGDHPGVRGRVLLSFLARLQRADPYFLPPVRPGSRLQPRLPAGPGLAARRRVQATGRPQGDACPAEESGR